jgi:transcriptional regulator with AAA-type ATPase domain
VYHAYLTALRDELGAEPDPNIRAEYERLLASERSQASATARTASTPFVGRTAEWARTLAAWQAAAGGRSRLLLVIGEQGIGKTRLAEEMLAWAARQGIPAAIAHCYAAEGDLAYAPAAAWLRSDALQPRLARLDPNLADRDCALGTRAPGGAS